MGLEGIVSKRLEGVSGSVVEGSPAMVWRFYTGIIYFFLMSTAVLTARAQPMMVEDYAKTASRTAVMANVCARYFKLNVEQMRQWRRIAIEVGKQLSDEFDAVLKAEIKRRNAEVDRVIGLKNFPDRLS
jgi:hypothetical protein